MQSEFWQQRWQNDEIGFHEGTVNRFLAEHWPALSPRGDETVFVPLCGKSFDMVWLRERGHRVLGVELSSIACRAFFSERGVEPTVTETESFVHFAHDGIDLYCGDFFDLPLARFFDVELFYDRAALIALPPAVRQRYCARLGEIMGPGRRGLMITLDYPAQAFGGPPFAVSDEEVRRNLDRRFDIDRLYRAPLANERLIERGLKSATESVFRLTARTQGSS
ncbi:MAG: thiopurine S-methyltransferase [Wenzhouxiangella sp.]|jgi:thiopurine S-methyltransferase|nr:thiopurine S-methyltransferase [Wenzhouxiangella sp.]